MSIPVLACLASVVLPLAAPAQGSASAARQQAIVEARRNLASCQSLRAGAPQQVQVCVRECTRAVTGALTGADAAIAVLNQACAESLQAAQQVRPTTAAERQRQKEQDRLAAASRPPEPAPAPTGPPVVAAKAPVAPRANGGATSVPVVRSTSVPLTDGAIDWNAYENGNILHSVFAGNFEPYRKESFAVRVLLHEYLANFETRCEAFLPPDTVTVVSTMTRIYRNAYGAEYRDVVSRDKMRMAPRFVDGYQNYSSGTTGVAAMGGLMNPNAVGNLLAFLKAWVADVSLFFKVEACQGDAMVQLGENLARLTAGQRPLQAEPDAARVLASRQVRVSAQIEDADVRAKRVRAAAYWDAERKAWEQTPSTTPVKTNGGDNRLEIVYAAIPLDYVIPIPEPVGEQLVAISVKGPYSRRIRSIAVALGGPSYAIADFPQGMYSIYAADARKLARAGTWVLSCTYSNFSTRKTVHYWYRKVPEGLDRQAMKAAWSAHPLLEVQDARSSCPVVMPG
jgi:hypothetical protein